MKPKEINPIDLNQIDVAKTATEYDYKEWSNDISVTITSVNYDKDHKEVVAFKDELTRDMYFESRDKHIIRKGKFAVMKGLEVFSNTFGHSGAIRVDVPYDIIYNYNYIIVDMDDLNIPTNATGSQPVRHRFFYFIKGVNEIAPNDIELNIELDTWTTFQFDVTIGSSYLDRGHYAMAKGPSVKQYLDNPSENFELLGYDEPFNVNPTRTYTHIAWNQEGFKPYSTTVLGSGEVVNEMYVLIFANSNFDEINYGEVISQISVGSVSDSSNSMINRAYSRNVNLKQAYYSSKESSGTVATNTYAIHIDLYPEFMRKLKDANPLAFKSIIMVAILHKRMIDFDDISYINTPIGELVKLNNVSKKVKYDFNTWQIGNPYSATPDQSPKDAKYRKLSKLLTSPYTKMQIISPDGRVAEIKIEELGSKFSLTTFMNLMTDSLSFTYMFSGVSEQPDYKPSQYETFIDINNKIKKTDMMYRGDYGRLNELTFSIDVPTIIAVNRPSSNSIETLNRINELELKIQAEFIKKEKNKTLINAKKELSNSFRRINTERNSSLTRDITKKNNLLKRSLTQNDIDLLEYRSNRVIDVSNSIFNNNINTADYNNYLMRNVQYENFNTNIRTLEVLLSGNQMTEKLQLDTNNEYAKSIWKYSYTFDAAILALLGGTLAAPIIVGSIAGNKNSSSGSSGVSSPDKSAESSNFSSINISSGDNGSLKVSSVPSLKSANTSSSSSGNSTTADTKGVSRNSTGGGDIWTTIIKGVTATFSLGLQKEFDKGLIDKGYENATELLNISQSADSRNLTINNSSNETIFSNALAINNYIFTSSQFTQKDNQKISIQNTRDLINRTKYNSELNNDRETGNSDDNADLVYNNTLEQINKDNYSNDIGASNEILMVDAEVYDTIGDYQIELAKLRSSLLTSNIESVSSLSNSYLINSGQFGLQIQMKYLDKSKLKQVGDFFLKYGYASPMEIIGLKSTDLTVMSKFSYWKFDDIIIIGNNINESNKSIIRHMFLEGVRVYTNPDDIGTTSIYENEVK